MRVTFITWAVEIVDVFDCDSFRVDSEVKQGLSGESFWIGPWTYRQPSGQGWAVTWSGQGPWLRKGERHFPKGVSTEWIWQWLPRATQPDMARLDSNPSFDSSEILTVGLGPVHPFWPPLHVLTPKGVKGQHPTRLKTDPRETLERKVVRAPQTSSIGWAPFQQVKSGPGLDGHRDGERSPWWRGRVCGEWRWEKQRWGMKWERQVKFRWIGPGCWDQGFGWAGRFPRGLHLGGKCLAPRA